jgi:putative endonuclease
MDTLNLKKIGNQAENHACEYLQKKGLRLIERNYFCALGEIDLIMQDNDEIVFVEVRSRNQYGDALESIDEYKQAKLIKTAMYYLQKTKQYDKVNCRFDVIGINNNQLEWIKNAFSADYF